MKCPYCVSEIPDAAVVCSVCQRDLYLFKPLLERIQELEEKLAAVPPDTPETEPCPGTPELSAPDPARSTGHPPRSIFAALAWWTAPLLLLILGHWVMIFLYDTQIVYLRIFALLLPLPFGYLFARAARLPFAWGLLPAFLMASLAVLGMSGVTAVIDQVPTLPQNTADLREFIEFSLSIGLSFTTGLWLQHWALRHREQELRARQLTMAAGKAGHNRSLSESLSRLNDIGSGLVAFATTAFSIYTGLKGLTG